MVSLNFLSAASSVLFLGIAAWLGYEGVSSSLPLGKVVYMVGLPSILGITQGILAVLEFRKGNY